MLVIDANYQYDLWRIFFFFDIINFFLITFCMYNLKTVGSRNTADITTLMEANSLQHVCTWETHTGRVLFGGGSWQKQQQRIKTFIRSSRPLGFKCIQKAGKFTYHMHSICKNKRPFQARFVGHHDHCAPLHAAASPQGFKTFFYI